MKRFESDVIKIIKNNKITNQRMISEITNYSIGTVNQALKNLREKGYLNADNKLNDKAEDYLQEHRPKNAVILAAGYGMRMVPINKEVPKALLDVHGEPLIERMIRQLHEVGITEIYIVVGFMKEKFEYLIDDYGVELIVNSEYTIRNNLHSLAQAVSHISNTYIIPCDIWCKENPFGVYELYSWYMVSEQMDQESSVRVNRKKELVDVLNNQNGNHMIGIAYLMEPQSSLLKSKLYQYDSEHQYNDSFWEDALKQDNRLILSAKVVPPNQVMEINTYEQLRELDEESNHLKTDSIIMISESLHVNASEIKNITVLKKGMTNRSFLFECRNKKYIMRIPGEGTDLLINRKQEAQVYRTIKKFKICDDIVLLDSKKGYKVTEFIEGARVCDPENEEDLKKCMEKLRNFHALKLQVKHAFDIFGQIDFYESLWEGESVFRDYKITKENVFSLRKYIDAHVKERCLTHIDAVPDNFLFSRDGDIRLIDWEYAGMQDPHVDIAMFCIYSLYDKAQIDRLIDIYFEGQCTREIRLKIYCYISACGLLWSNWCEYKRFLGVEFGEYSLRQYRYAKEYYRLFQEELKSE